MVDVDETQRAVDVPPKKQARSPKRGKAWATDRNGMRKSAVRGEGGDGVSRRGSRGQHRGKPHSYMHPFPAAMPAGVAVALFLFAQFLTCRLPQDFYR